MPLLTHLMFLFIRLSLLQLFCNIYLLILLGQWLLIFILIAVGFLCPLICAYLIIYLLLHESGSIICNICLYVLINPLQSFILWTVLLLCGWKPMFVVVHIQALVLGQASGLSDWILWWGVCTSGCISSQPVDGWGWHNSPDNKTCSAKCRWQATWCQEKTDCRRWVTSVFSHRNSFAVAEFNTNMPGIL